MPKSAPDQVIIHRIEFQESEREILRDVALSYNFNRVMQPLVALINDNTTLLLILSAIGAWLGLNYIPPLVENTYEMIVDFQEQLQSALDQGTILKERVDIVGSAIQRGPLWGGIDLAEAFFGVNLPDFGAGYEPSDTGGGGGF
ncbi:MAG TPA: hypothetical protein EYN66_06420 [Myxococcales bacterium]|nr:hypothetical protein [Myxococcales bacterium]